EPLPLGGGVGQVEAVLREEVAHEPVIQVIPAHAGGACGAEDAKDAIADIDHGDVERPRPQVQDRQPPVVAPRPVNPAAGAAAVEPARSRARCGRTSGPPGRHAGSSPAIRAACSKAVRGTSPQVPGTVRTACASRPPRWDSAASTSFRSSRATRYCG